MNSKRKTRIFGALLLLAVIMALAAAAVSMASDTVLEKDDPKILEFVQRYYEAVDAKNEFAVSRMAYPWDDEARDAFNEQEAVTGHQDIETWSIDNGSSEYIVFVRCNREDGEGKLVPDMYAIFLFENAAGNLMITTSSDQEHHAAEKMQEAMTYPEVQELIAKVRSEYEEEPETEAPETEAPETEAPQTEASETEAPQTEAPQTEYQDPKKEYIFWDSDQRYLSDDEIKSLSLQAMNYAKNEIYARRGRKFLSVELQQYFGSKSWYNGYIDAGSFSESVFNDYELHNAHRINELESQRAGTAIGYPLDQPGYDITAVGTASYEKTGESAGGLYVGDNGEVAVG